MIKPPKSRRSADGRSVTFRGALLVIVATLATVLFVTLSSVGSEPSNPSFERALATCTACHGKDGRSEDSNIPHLRAQNYDYLVNQLVRFARLQPGSSTMGEDTELSPIVRGIESIRNRHSETMEQHVATADDGTVRDLARYFSQLPCNPSERSAQSRAQPKGSTWCNDCHAPKTARRTTNVPLLNGQHADYLEAQLLAFKRAAADADQENSRFHHFMSRSVRTWSDDRLREVAEYYAGQSCVK